MKDKTEEKLLKGCGEFELGRSPCSKDNLCDDCELKLKQHRETKKEILDKIEKFRIEKRGNVFMSIVDEITKELKKEIEEEK